VPAIEDSTIEPVPERAERKALPLVAALIGKRTPALTMMCCRG
jgi:hypothetical protein